MRLFGIFALTALAASVPVTDQAEAQRKKNRMPTAQEMAAEMERERAATIAGRDQQIAEAHAAGKVILFTRTMNLDRIYASDQISRDLPTKILFNANYSSRTKWAKRGDPSFVASIGNSDRKAGHAHNPITNFADKSSLDEMYQVYIIEPGEYDLIGHSNFLRMTSAPNVHWAGQGGAIPQNIGKVVMRETTNEEAWYETQWQNTQYQTRVVTDQYCTSVYVHGGRCAAWGSSERNVTDVSKPAGYYDTPIVKVMPAVVASFELTRPFASFSAAAGDVIVIDGLFADYPNADFAAKDCLRIAKDQVECGVSNYSLIQLPTSVAGLNKAIASIAPQHPQLAAIAQKARTVPIKMNGSPGGTPSRWGPRYIVTNEK